MRFQSSSQLLFDFANINYVTNLAWNSVHAARFVFFHSVIFIHFVFMFAKNFEFFNGDFEAMRMFGQMYWNCLVIDSDMPGTYVRAEPATELIAVV